MVGYPYEAHLVLRLLLAVLCGAVLGYERERHGRSAGLRTNLLVCVGAALMMIVSKYFYFKPGEFTGNITTALDPSRIAAQIVTGIGFLGAGVIIKERGSIRGLTTAATLWYNAGVGMACGAGMIILPIVCTLIGLASLTALKRVESRIPRDSYKVVHVECEGLGEQALLELKEYFTDRHIHIVTMNFSQHIKETTTNYEFVVKGNWNDNELLSHISQLSNFEFVSQTRLS
ncbi:MgtC/SapB family protein [Geobacter sp. SVR]|uniref:MgtC/SapB family protein n=1 Tax=Geobacter sp. SVR TaxID=2495594 RepID=UPI00143EF6CF|nr:MgtC/SapB family protein [Geobacter sp. SVR]BCS52264.1 magnesium transporter MgtC [Geobacter sp. SVR]GCF85075.1 magnesium transporter MgtC [Geobacter sp. SVR]